jgi:hypothetical protein
MEPSQSPAGAREARDWVSREARDQLSRGLNSGCDEAEPPGAGPSRPVTPRRGCAMAGAP